MSDQDDTKELQEILRHVVMGTASNNPEIQGRAFALHDRILMKELVVMKPITHSQPQTAVYPSTVEIRHNGMKAKISGQTMNAIMADIKDGKIIPAIKTLRIETGFGLKDAKDYIESIRP